MQEAEVRALQLKKSWMVQQRAMEAGSAKKVTRTVSKSCTLSVDGGRKDNVCGDQPAGSCSSNTAEASRGETSASSLRQLFSGTDDSHFVATVKVRLFRKRLPTFVVIILQKYGISLRKGNDQSK